MENLAADKTVPWIGTLDGHTDTVLRLRKVNAIIFSTVEPLPQFMGKLPS